jgi:hypothetical protein
MPGKPGFLDFETLKVGKMMKKSSILRNSPIVNDRLKGICTRIRDGHLDFISQYGDEG